MFDEDKHPRDNSGKFTDKSASELKDELMQELPSQPTMTEKNIWQKEKVVTIDLNTETQQQFDQAAPKERQKIAFKYIMNNLRGKYPTSEGRIVAIEKVGADKMSHTLNETKIRVLPELANLIEAGELEGIVESQKEFGQQHKLFTHFAYYRVTFQIGSDRYVGRLNVGIRADGSSTLYDLNPFNRQ